MPLTNKTTTSGVSYFVLVAALGFSITSCRASNPADVPPTVMVPFGEVASYKVQLDVRGGKCIFNYDGPFKGQVETGLLAPCEFLRDSVGNLQHMELKNTRQNGGGTYSVILLIGGPPNTDPDRPRKHVEGCGSESLPISLSPRGIALGSRGGGLDICPTDRVDEKLFTADSRHV